MNLKEKLQELAKGLNAVTTENGLKFLTHIIPGEVDVLVLTVEQREEFPIYITIDDSQMLCITHLWKESEVVAGKRNDLLDTLLSMNVSMPLSHFGKVSKQYIIFGALSTHSDLDDVIEEVSVLSDNTLTALEELKEFLAK